MSFSDQRRYPRVQVLKNLNASSPELQAQVTWPNFETSVVSDLSYKGMAVRRPGLFPIDVHQVVDVDVELGGRPAFRTTARIAWGNLDWVGLEFSSLPPEGHRSLRDFLDAKLIGSTMKPVERVFISENQSFHYWYQGVGQTHVYIWLGSNQAVARVVVDLNGQVSEFRCGEKTRLSGARQRALLVLSQMDKADLPMEEFLRSLLPGA